MAVERELRIRLTKLGDVTEVVVPGRWDPIVVLNLLITLPFLVYFWPKDSSTPSPWDVLFSSNPFMIVVVLIFFAVTSVWFAGSIFWSTFGSEKIRINERAVDHEFRLFGWAHARTFASHQVISAGWTKISRLKRSLRARLGSHIVMELAGNRKAGFAYGTSESEARVILDALTQVARIPQK